MKGMKCRCGYATVSDKHICPRCGKRMSEAEWRDEGKVLSFTKLQAAPEGLSSPYNLVLVAIEKGPKVVCWTSGTLSEDVVVSVVEKDGKYLCVPKEELDLGFDHES